MSITLDEYCKRREITSIALIKVDVEGAEAAVLAGAAELLRTIKPRAVICEVQPSEAEPDAPDLLLQAFDHHGYEPHEILPDGSLGPLNRGRLGEMGLNLCFLPREQ